MNKLYKVGIYLRLSKEDVNKKDDSESIKNQRLLLLNEINKHDDFIFEKEYCDENLSGAGTYRKAFEELIKDCENKKIDIVMCKSQSRFSRDMEIVERYIHNKFKEWNIRFISLVDGADTLNYGNKKSRQINALVNEWFLEDTSNNIRSAFKAKMKNGEFISPFAPYGYKISKTNKNKLTIDKDASIIVKEIFNLYLTGLSYTEIANYLNSQNIDSPSIYKKKHKIKLNIVSNNISYIKWNINTIKTILTNEIYIGNLVQGKRSTVSYKNHKIIKKDKNEWIKTEKTHKPIIDIDTFKKANKKISENRKTIIKSNNNPYSGLVYCSNCNKKLKKKSSKKYSYLTCTCKNSSIRYDYLDSIITRKLQIDLNENDKKMIIKLLINRIIINNNLKEIKIFWNI